MARAGWAELQQRRSTGLRPLTACGPPQPLLRHNVPCKPPSRFRGLPLIADIAGGGPDGGGTAKGFLLAGRRPVFFVRPGSRPIRALTAGWAGEVCQRHENRCVQLPSTQSTEK